MKRLIISVLILFLTTLPLYAAVDEYKIDLYYANGMLGNSLKSEQKAWDVYVETIQSSVPALDIERVNSKIAYNASELWGGGDVIEVLFQRIIGDTVSWLKVQDMFKEYVDENNLIEVLDSLSQAYNFSDLSTQVKNYKENISNGHGVIVVAHSQGNFFTNKAFEYLDDWMKPYFHMTGVASPSIVVANNGPRVSFDNDPVPLVALAPTTIVNKNRFHAVSGLDLPHFNYHSFTYYLGAAVTVNDYDTLKQVSTLQGRSKIDTAVLLAIGTHLSAPSQWKPKGKNCGTKGCGSKDIKVTHKESPKTMDSRLKSLVYPFNTSNGKIYQINGKYVLGGFGGETITNNPADGICYKLEETNEIIEGTKLIREPFTIENGVIETTLGWNYENDIDMDLYMMGPRNIVQKDVEDIPNVGIEHSYVKSSYEIRPGDLFELFATGEQLTDSELDESCLDTDPVNIYAIVKTPAGSKFKQYQARNFAELSLGKYAEIEVQEKIQPKWICPALSDSPGWHNLYNADTGKFQCVQCWEPYSVEWRPTVYNQDVKVQNGYWYCNIPRPTYIYSKGGTESNGIRTYNQCNEEEKKHSCGCVPCEYIVRGMENSVEYGPIAGAQVEIVTADSYGEPYAPVLYHGTTTSHEDILKAGLVKLSDTDKAKFEDDQYYVISAKGGEDVDRNDDLIADDTSTPNNGTIHAIIKGSDLKFLSFRVNVLTEAIYQVSGGLLGSGYDSEALLSKLDDAAKKLLKEKLYPGDSDMNIAYRDILLWAPGVDKRAMYKPYDIFVEPIVEKTYSDSPRFDESYTLIYEPFDSDDPLLSPMTMDIPQGLPNSTPIAKAVTQNQKAFSMAEIKGDYAEHFKIDNDGMIRINDTALIVEGNRYALRMRAIDNEANAGSWVGLNIQVTKMLELANPDASVPYLSFLETFDIEENSPAGTVVANTVFEDSNQTIVGYKLHGENNTSFTVDDQGVVTVSEGVDIDYEKSRVYQFSISAYNDVGNESYPILVSINISNEIDTPLYPLVFFTHIEENQPIGIVIGQLELLREGLSSVTSFEILSPNIPFMIDSNGTVKVSDYIDFEQDEEFRFIARANSQHGKSNKIECQIIIDNQAPEIGIPTLENMSIIVDENISSGSKIGQLIVDAGATRIERIALYGEDDNFRVDSNGSVYLVDHASLDYETKSRYDLGARALNSRGYGNEAHIVINVNNIADELPTLGAFRGAIDENASLGTLIGNIQIGASAEVVIESIIFNGEGSEDFVIDSNGSIYVSSAAQLDYENKKSYVLKAVASSSTGFISEGEVIISLYNVPEFVPVLKTLSVSVEERAAIGTVVGTIEVESVGDTAILSFDLNETTVFSVDKNGTIRLVSELDWSNRSQCLLEITANNSAGVSIPVSANITILRNNYSSGELDDQFTGSSRDEIFDTKDGDDVVYAQAGNDIVIGGKGNDILYGGLGDDVYKYSLGDGNDTIEDAGGVDQLLLHDIEKNRLSFSLSETSLIIHIGEDNSTIVIQNWKNDSYKIENIVFDDETEIGLEDFNLPLVKPDAGIVDLSK